MRPWIESWCDRWQCPLPIHIRSSIAPSKPYDQPAKLLGYEVILAELGENLIKTINAKEALNVLLKTDIPVVLMAVCMPDVDGFELADLIRQHPRFQKTPIIFIFGVHLTYSDKIQGYRSGAVDYISVPVVHQGLRAKIAIFVELHKETPVLERLNSDLERRVEERTEELRQSEAQFRTRAELLDLATEAIMVRNLEGAIEFWNNGADTNVRNASRSTYFNARTCFYVTPSRQVRWRNSRAPMILPTPLRERSIRHGY